MSFFRNNFFCLSDFFTLRLFKLEFSEFRLKWSSFLWVDFSSPDKKKEWKVCLLEAHQNEGAVYKRIMPILIMKVSENLCYFSLKRFIWFSPQFIV